jgi:hypothetical protein
MAIGSAGVKTVRPTAPIAASRKTKNGTSSALVPWRGLATEHSSGFYHRVELTNHAEGEQSGPVDRRPSSRAACVWCPCLAGRAVARGVARAYESNLVLVAMHHNSAGVPSPEPRQPVAGASIPVHQYRMASITLNRTWHVAGISPQGGLR